MPNAADVFSCRLLIEHSFIITLMYYTTRTPVASTSDLRPLYELGYSYSRTLVSVAPTFVIYADVIYPSSCTWPRKSGPTIPELESGIRMTGCDCSVTEHALSNRNICTNACKNETHQCNVLFRVLCSETLSSLSKHDLTNIRGA